MLSTPVWQAFIGGAVSLIVAGVSYLVWVSRKTEIAVLQLQREVFDPGGENGLKRKMGRVKVRLDELEAWKIRQDTIDAIEEEQMRDVGRQRERLRDKLSQKEE